MGEAPAAPGQPPLSEADQQLVMHIELPILGGHVLMGSDAPESMRFKRVGGNNLHINLETDTRADRPAVLCAVWASACSPEALLGNWKRLARARDLRPQPAADSTACASVSNGTPSALHL
jgi:hypothetical protein